jgi:hypothetical protein
MFDQIRQGDILLVATDKALPKGLQPHDQIILAKGETTGHAHRLKAGEVYDWNEDNQRYIHVKGEQPGELSHEDHDPVPAAVVEPSITYRVIPQQEWDLTDQWRKVVD